MISIYCFSNVIHISIILMVNVMVSNSNYLAIKTSDGRQKNVKNKYDISTEYYEYIIERKEFGQHVLDPHDFILSMYTVQYLCKDKWDICTEPAQKKSTPTSGIQSPYYYFYPTKESNYDSYVLYDERFNIPKYILNFLKQKDSISLKPTNNDLRYIGINPKYWDKRPKFYEVNYRIVLMGAAFKLLHIFGYDPLFFGNEVLDSLNKLSKNESTGNEVLDSLNKLSKNESTVPPVLDLSDIFMTNEGLKVGPTYNNTDLPNFITLGKSEFSLIKSFMSYLPQDDESVDDYIKRYEEIVKFYFFLNKYVQYLNQIKPVSKDRVNNLKLPHLLKHESYNYYVIRMINMKIVPFHLDFLKKNFKVFKDWKQVTIFEELGYVQQPLEF